MRRTLDTVENEGLSRVRSIGGEVFPASLNWTYSYALGDGTSGASVTLYLRDEPVFNSNFHVAREWAVLEEDFETVALALGNFKLNAARGDPENQVSLVKTNLRDGGVRGATIARDARHRSDPLFIPDKWE